MLTTDGGGVQGEQMANPPEIVSSNHGTSDTLDASSALVQLTGLSKSYDEAGQNRMVLDQLDRKFRSGDFVCLLGKSGSGKSTLLNLISGIDSPSAGSVTFHNGGAATVLTDLSEHERTLFRRKHIGIVFQFFNLIPTLTVLENVTLPIELSGGNAQMRQKAVDLLERVGLGDRLSTFPDKLSGGEQQRVAIARALVHDPLLVLADEPTGNLDEETSESVLDMLLELTKSTGRTLFMATHAAEVASRADRVLHLEHGKLIRDEAWRASHPEFAGFD